MKTAIVENRYPIKTTLLSIAVTLAGAMVAALAVARQTIDPQHAWMMMIALSLFLAPMSTVQIPGIKASVVLGDVVTFACAFLFGPSAAIIAAVADGAISSLRLTKDYRKFLYNVATCSVSMGGACLLTGAAFPRFGVQNVQVVLGELVGQVAVFTFAYFIISTLLVASYVAFSKGISLIKLWREKFLWTIMSYIASGASCFATFLVVGQFGLYVFMVLVAVMLLVFLCYRLYFQKLQSEMVEQSA